MVFWDPVVGCTPISPSCLMCGSARNVHKAISSNLLGNPVGAEKYANITSIRGNNYVFNGTVNLNPDALPQPLGWDKNAQIFVAGRSDLFHEKVPFEYIKRVVDVSRSCPLQTYFVLTKRASRLYDFCEWIGEDPFPFNFWVGVTTENQKYADERLPLLCEIPAVRAISAKPLLSDLNIDKYLPHLHLVIVGGESGKNARPTHPAWVRNLRDKCAEFKVPFCFHQWGANIPGGQSKQIEVSHEGETVVLGRTGNRKDGFLFEGKMYDEYPDDAHNLERTLKLYTRRSNKC